MKHTIISLLSLMIFCPFVYSQSRCIPYLLFNKNKDKKVYVYDSCIDDTIKVQFKVSIVFNDTTLYDVRTVVLQSVRIDKDRAFLSRLDKERTVFHQYIWDICNAKVTYWYKNQPYNQFYDKMPYIADNMIFGAMFYLVPNRE